MDLRLSRAPVSPARIPTVQPHSQETRVKPLPGPFTATPSFGLDNNSSSINDITGHLCGIIGPVAGPDVAEVPFAI